MTVPKAIAAAGLLSTSQVAKQLGVHRSTVWGWIKQDMIASEKRGSFHGIKPSELKKFLSWYDIKSAKKTTGKKA